MVDGNKLKMGAYLLLGLIGIIVAIYATLMISGLVIGTIAATATDGTVGVSSAMNTSIAGMETSYITNTTALYGNLPLIIGLVAIVVIMTVFGFKNMFKGGSGKSVE